MAVTVNGHSTPATPGLSLFDHAERLGIPVPTSCQKQGKCRECIVEVSEGVEHLSPPAFEERHLSGNFRLSCRTLVSEPCSIRCHTMRRGQMRIETRGVGRPIAHEPAA